MFKDTEISQMQTYWQQMSSDTKSECKDVPAALGFLIEWSRVQRETVRANLENKYASDEAQRQENQDELRITMEKYIEGDSTETELQDAIKNTYGAKSPAVKNHIKNIESILIKSINGAIDDGTAYTAEYFSLINEMLPTIQNAYTARYIAEMNARTVEWEQKIYDLNQKQKSWYEAVELIISRGRDDWKKGVETIQARYNVWVKSYSEEYEKVNAQWGAAYMESLQDKAEWVAQATEAANKTSTNVTLAMLGADAEKRARAIDNRDFSSISTASGIMESQKALSEILNSAGINNMEAAFNAINNSSSTISTIVRTGLSGGNVWNSAEAKLAAVKIVNKSNEELAEREAKIVAANVRRTAESAIAGLQETVDSANKNFDRSMNDTFLLKGRWSRTGNTYKKDVIVDSSLTSTDRESVTVTSYIPYKMEAIVFKTDLSDKHLEGLESFAVNALVNQMNKEISDFAEGIFGKNNEKGEKEKGSFDKYLGDAPVVKAEPDIEKDKSGAFDSYGTGEIGRLMSDYIYWAMKEGSGIQKLSAPIYSQPLWSSDSSWFKSPSLEEVVEILMSVATAGLGASMAIADVVKHAAINVIDDFVFGTFDGLKTGDWANVGLEFGKTVTTTFSTDIAGWGARKVSSIAGGGRSPIVKALITAGITTAASMASAAVTGVVNALSISEEGKLQFSRDAYEEGIIRSVKGVAVSVVNTMTSGLLEQFNIGKIITKGEVSGPEKLIGFNKTNIADVGKLNNLVGSLAGQAMNYALNGDFALNLLNLNKLTGGEYKSGLLELHLTKNGASMNIGTGGADVSYGNIASAMKGANVWALNNDINSYSETSGNENKITLRAQYGYGDAQQRQNLYDILNGGAKLNMVENIITADGEFAKGQTELLDGQRVINLVGTKEKMSIAEQFAMAITLGHESYRDGVTDINNLIETQNAVFWHSAMAVRMIQDEVYTNAIGAVIAGDKNLQNDISAYLTGNINFFNQYVNANYDSSADYWKLKQYKDGSILLEDDEKKDQLTIEYYDSDKTTLLGSTSQVLSNKDGIDGRDGRAASLAQMLGLEHLSKMLGIDTSKMSLNEAGVALLTKNGFEWNDSKGIWSSASGEGNFDMSAFTINGNLYTVLNDQGTLNWYSAKEEIIRDPMSYAILTNGKRDLKYGGLDSIIVTQYDLDGKIVNTITSNGWTTVQSLIPTKEDGNITGYTFKDFLKATWSSVVKGCSGLPQSGLSGVFNVGPETIAVGEVAYKLLERQTSNETIKLQKGDFYFQAVSGKLVSGSSIDVNGHTELSNSALLKHDTGYFGNTGCFVTGNGVQGSGVVWKQYMNFIKNNAQMPSGYVLRGTVSNKNSPVKVSKPMK
ncbi:MAG: hypothetical protein Ta2F_04220 [Termitinemataceae bacterium]|nr:MAG: hypothetical protein Ta2F_04220 [Termitinemataceae bacterium]